MKPLAVLLGIVMGSAIALAVCLSMTGIVFLLLPEYSARLASEQAPLVKGLAWSWSSATVSAAAFVGELRVSQWRRVPQWALVLLLGVLSIHFWPT